MLTLTFSASIEDYFVEQYASELQDSLRWRNSIFTFLIKTLSVSRIYYFVICCTTAQWKKTAFFKCAQTHFPRAQMRILQIRGQLRGVNIQNYAPKVARVIKTQGSLWALEPIS
jgi:hypothetical protein